MTDSSRTGVLARIHHLLALAASDNEHEARNAAIIAARMIRSEGVLLSLPHDSRSAGPTAPTEGLAPIVIQSKFSGLCRSCGSAYAIGDRVQWARGRGAAHATCPWGLS